MKKMKNEYESKIDELYSEVGRLTTQVNWLKKNLEARLSRKDHVAMLEWEDAELPVKTRDLKIDHPNQVWAIDITYVSMKKS